MKSFLVIGALILTTLLAAGGDALVRVGLLRSDLFGRAGFMLAGAAVLFGYGFTLNLSPLHWGRSIGGYVATFFIVAQIINFGAFKTPPSLAVVVRGAFILARGAIVTLWRPRCGIRLITHAEP